MNTVIELDGKPLWGVTHLSLNLAPSEFTTVTITMYCKVDADVAAELRSFVVEDPPDHASLKFARVSKSV